MTTLEKNKTSEPGNRSVETGSERIYFSGYPPCSAGEDLFRIAKRVNQSLEDSYDRLRNSNIKISSRLWVCSVSDHFALLDNQASDSSDVTEDIQALAQEDLAAIH